MDTNSFKSENEIENFEIQSFSKNLKTCIMKESNIRINLKKKRKMDLNKEKKNNQILSSIKLNNYSIYLCFCFARTIKNKNNILLDEAMKIISEKMDILNLFRNMCLQENFQKELGKEYGINKMSEECIKLLSELKIK